MKEQIKRIQRMRDSGITIQSTNLHTVVLIKTDGTKPIGRTMKDGCLTIVYDPAIGPGTLPPMNPAYKIICGLNPFELV